MAEATANAHDTVVLEVSWGACTRLLDGLFARAAHVAWSVNGTPIRTTTVWTPPAPSTAYGDSTSACVVPTTTAWRTYGQFPTTFRPGVYTVSVIMWTDVALPDGNDLDGDGRMDLFGGPAAPPWEGSLVLTVTR